MYDICDEGVWNNFITLFSIYLDDVSVLWPVRIFSPNMLEPNVGPRDSWIVWCAKTKPKPHNKAYDKPKYFYKLVAGEFYCERPVICRLLRPQQSCVWCPVFVLCCGLMIMGCSRGLACDVWCELPRRYHWARPFGLSKGRDGLGGFCANNSWVYMVGSVQIDTICFPISRLAIEYKAHNQRQRARSTLGTWGNCAMIKT